MKRLIIFILLMCTQTTLSYQYEIALCAIFQNEGRFLKEWLEFYKLIGVQHFYLYNNKSTDNYLEILTPYIAQQEVTLMDWPTVFASPHAHRSHIQVLAYNHCLQEVRGIVKWLAFLDIDEFLFPVKHNTLAPFLKEYEPYGAVCANWVMFGTSHVQTIPENKLLIETLTLCASYPDVHIKSIVQPEKVAIMSAHAPTQFYPGFFQVTADKIRFEGPVSPSLAVNQIRINHYWTRDEQWLYEEKISRREKQNNDTAEWIISVAGIMNEQKDLTISKYVESLKKILHPK